MAEVRSATHARESCPTPVAIAMRSAAVSVFRRGGQEGAPWDPVPCATGHFAAVADMDWAVDGSCLLSAGEDQTVRLLARDPRGHWCEIARPQVHGHDFSCVAAVPTASSSSSDGGLASARYVYASGSEEKVVRVFESPVAFLETVAMARGDAAAAAALQAESAAAAAAGRRPLGAAVGGLGLTNKAVHREDLLTSAADSGAEPGADLGGEELNEYEGPMHAAVPAAVPLPALEEHLSRNTLWPEVQKLYGHGSDLVCMVSVTAGERLVPGTRGSVESWCGHLMSSRVSGGAPTRLPAGICLQGPDGSGGRDLALALFELDSSGPPVGALPDRYPAFFLLEWSAAGLLLEASRCRGSVVASSSAAASSQLLCTHSGGSLDRLRLSCSFPRVSFAPYCTISLVSLPSRGPWHQGKRYRGLFACRDRSWALFRQGTADGEYELACRVDKAHGRIVWGISISHDERLVATGSRDKTVKLWRVPAADAGSRDASLSLALPAFAAGVTAVQFAPLGSSLERQLLAVGLEDGQVQVWAVRNAGTVSAEPVWTSGPGDSHCDVVSRLRWRKEDDGTLLLASCGHDHAVRIRSVSREL